MRWISFLEGKQSWAPSIAAAMVVQSCGISPEIVGSKIEEATLARWTIRQESTNAVLASGCARAGWISDQIKVAADPGERIAVTAVFERVTKESSTSIPMGDDAYWCGSQDDRARNPERRVRRETCAQTESDAPAQLESVELVNPRVLGSTTDAEGYVLHLTVRNAGLLWLVFPSPPCSVSDRRAELTILAK